VFFEQPDAMQAGHPELYAVLVAFYGTDPAAWPATQPGVAREGSFTR